ncbi:MAG: polymerase [Actinomycetota bacterium]|jgi:DNA polymerase-4|nr:polymerase [Actinomycetota bacterium]
MVVPEPILHVDMDAFYASVEMIKDPTLKGKPVIVGGQGGRGVVTSASYEARAFGVTSAMPVVRARRLCPHGIFVSNDFSSYQDFSHRIRTVFTSFTPMVEPLSLDEAFLDVSGSVRLFGTSLEIARQIKSAIADLGLGCSVGVAPNKFLAKLASAWAKPDGLLLVPADDVLGFLHPLPVSALWGVGPHTDETLRRLGMKTVGDLARLSRRTLERALGEALGAHLHALANGIDDRQVVVNEPSKSVGSEETYERDLDSAERVLRELLRLADRTAGRLRTKDLCGRTVTIKIRFSNFKTITRSKTLPCEVDTAAEIYDVAKNLYERLHPDRPRIRLVGVSVSGLAPGPPRRQLDLLGDGTEGRPVDERRASMAHAVDTIRSRFGDASVAPATLIPGPE